MDSTSRADMASRAPDLSMVVVRPILVCLERAVWTGQQGGNCQVVLMKGEYGSDAQALTSFVVLGRQGSDPALVCTHPLVGCTHSLVDLGGGGPACFAQNVCLRRYPAAVLKITDDIAYVPCARLATRSHAWSHTSPPVSRTRRSLKAANGSVIQLRMCVIVYCNKINALLLLLFPVWNVGSPIDCSVSRGCPAVR
jgi:hypothetical protein